MKRTNPTLVVIGGSLGGFDAVCTILGGLPANFPASVAVVLHRLADWTSRLQSLLLEPSAMPVSEPSHGDRLEPGRVFLSPADYHMMIEGDRITLSTEAKVFFARPSIDVLFESAAISHGPRAIAVILTGASEDGARGAAAMAGAGARVVVQDPSQARAPVAPRAALQHVADPLILPVERIAPCLIEQMELR